MMRGQSSLEAIALFASATLVLTLFMLYFGTQIASHAEEREFESLRDIADTIRQEIQLARQAGPGYTRTLELPRSGGGKALLFTLEYPLAGSGPSEMTLRFEPPISDTLEANEVLGEGVYGVFSGGRNTIRTYPGGIIVTPDPDVYVELHGDGVVADPIVVAAFAHLSGPTVMLRNRIECEYAIANEWALDRLNTFDSSDYHLYVAWNVENAVGDVCHRQNYKYGDRIVLSDHGDFPGAFVKGANLSCEIAFTKDSSFNICSPNGDERIASSGTVRIVNSPPHVTIEDWSVTEGVDNDTSNRTEWDIRFSVNVSDADHDDGSFNVSIVRDGTNALYLSCVDPPDCRHSEVDEYDVVEFRTQLVVPWPQGGECGDVNRLSFRLNTIEADASDALNTLTSVTFGRLPCPGDGDSTKDNPLDPATYPITITIDGQGEVRVEWGSSEQTITNTQTISLPRDVDVYLTALPGGWTFDGWSGDHSSSDDTLSVTMVSAKSVTAHFNPPIVDATLAIGSQGSGSVLVEYDDQSQTIHGEKTFTLPIGTQVNLTAQPDEGARFSQWTGGEDENPKTITLTEDRTLTAYFVDLDSFELSVETDGGGLISVNGAEYSSMHVGSYDEADPIEIHAQALTGYAFSRWTLDGAEHTERPLIFEMMDNHSVIAHFEPLPYTVTLNVGAGGIVVVAGTEYGPDTTVDIDVVYGQTVSLEARADSGWMFDAWSGDLSSTDPNGELTITGDATVTASFVPVYTLDIDFVGFGSVNVDGEITSTASSFSFEEGRTINLNAIESAVGWEFERWSGDLTGTNTPDSIVMDADKQVTVHFDLVDQGDSTHTYTDGPNTYVVHTYTTVGTSEFTMPHRVSTVDYLIVAGGGGGGARTTWNAAPAGGGGAGGMVEGTRAVEGTVDVVVGGGGRGGIPQFGVENIPEQGEDSRFDSTIAVGGGRGTQWTGDANNRVDDGGDGGSGGGGRNHGSGGSGESGQGHDGGGGYYNSYYRAYTAGGGGGVGQQGFSGHLYGGGDGGSGRESSITGSVVWYAGGGGGGTHLHSRYGTTGGSGGSGGGGDAGPHAPSAGRDATPNTGGGGGGASGEGQVTIHGGGDGGSGIVIVRYLDPR